MKVLVVVVVVVRREGLLLVGSPSSAPLSEGVTLLETAASPAA